MLSPSGMRRKKQREKIYSDVLSTGSQKKKRGETLYYKGKARSHYYGIHREKEAVEKPVENKYGEECQSLGFQNSSCKANGIQQ